MSHLIHELVIALIDKMVVWTSVSLIPIMLFAMIGAVVTRALIYFTWTRHEWFAKEFEKRVNKFLDVEKSSENTASFYMTVKKLLEKTYYEVFENRIKLKRRKGDTTMHMTDRIFLIKQGCAWLVRDVLRQVRYLKYGSDAPKLLNVTKSSLATNPCFNRLFGVIPTSGLTDMLNILPGLFVIGGIFGTFLGIMKGLPELSNMNMNDSEQTKMVMDQFLVNIAFAMNTSIFGIFCSVTTTVFNTIFSSEKKFVSTVDRFESCLDVIWNRCDHNDVPAKLKEFDENQDPMETLAQEALNQELEKSGRTRELDKIHIGKKTG